MENSKSPFTEIERDILIGLASKVATKRSCKKYYVNKIISGDRGINTDLAKLIYSDLLELLETLTIKIQ